MHSLIKFGADRFAAFRKDRPQEFRWLIGGAVFGAILGLFVGGIGVAAFGSAAGASAWPFLAFLGGLIGDREGVERDRRSSE